MSKPTDRQRAPAPAPDRVFTLRQFSQLNGIGYRSAQRLIASGQGPRVTQLTERRIGIRESDAAEWQAARLRSIPADKASA
jgi:predicted DNA-binding transcriptional regulator AlpA